MCILCAQWNAGLLSTKDAARNFRELANTLDIEHAIKLADELQIALLKEELENE